MTYRRPDRDRLAADRWMVDTIREVLGKAPLYSRDEDEPLKTYPDPDSPVVDGHRRTPYR